MLEYDDAMSDAALVAKSTKKAWIVCEYVGSRFDRYWIYSAVYESQVVNDGCVIVARFEP